VLGTGAADDRVTLEHPGGPAHADARSGQVDLVDVVSTEDAGTLMRLDMVEDRGRGAAGFDDRVVPAEHAGEAVATHRRRDAGHPVGVEQLDVEPSVRCGVDVGLKDSDLLGGARDGKRPCRAEAELGDARPELLPAGPRPAGELHLGSRTTAREPHETEVAHRCGHRHGVALDDGDAVPELEREQRVLGTEDASAHDDEVLRGHRSCFRTQPESRSSA